MDNIVDINVSQTVNPVSFDVSTIEKVVDINVSQIVKAVSFNVTPNLITINVNKVIGGLASVTSVNGIVGDVILNIPSIEGLATTTYVNNQDALKVDKITGKGLSSNDYTTIEKNKLAGVSENAEVNVNADWNSISGDSQILNKPIIPSIDGLATTIYVDSQDALKVDKITGKGLSTNDYTTLEQTKLSSIEFGAEVNVNADWNSLSGDSLILNKPSIPSINGLATITYVNEQDALKVDKASGYGLSKNDFTDVLKTKLDSVASGAEVNVNANWNSTSGDSQILNKPDIDGLASKIYVDNQDALKVDKVVGERLINATEITKLSNQSGINTGDQDLSGLASVTYVNTQGFLKTVGISDLTATGTPSSTTYLRGDNTWATVTSGSSYTFTSPLIDTLGTITINQSNTETNGYLSFTDWNTFNNKQSSLSGTGFVKSSAGVISYDTNTYITGNQTISLSGAVSGSGTTSISTTLANSIVGISNLTATGTPSATTYLRGDNTWAIVEGGGGGTTAVKLTSQTLTAASWTLNGGYYVYSFSNVNIDATCDVSVTPQNASYLTAYNAQIMPYIAVTTGVATFYSQFPPSADIIVDIVITQTA